MVKISLDKVLKEKDLTLEMRGSRNQRIIDLSKKI